MRRGAHAIKWAIVALFLLMFSAWRVLAGEVWIRDLARARGVEFAAFIASVIPAVVFLAGYLLGSLAAQRWKHSPTSDPRTSSENQTAQASAGIRAEKVTPEAPANTIPPWAFALGALNIAVLILLCAMWLGLTRAINYASVDESAIADAQRSAALAAKEAASAHCWAKRTGQNYAERQEEENRKLLVDNWLMRGGREPTPANDCD